MSGYLYRPVRETSIEKLFAIAEQARKNSGLTKVSLIGTASSKYSKIDELIKSLRNRGFKVPTLSMRIESIKQETLTALKENRGKTIAITPESISSLRKSINKNIDDNKIFDIIKNGTEIGLNIKLYFLIGLPKMKQKKI